MSFPLSTCTDDDKFASIIRSVSWCCEISSASDRVTVFCSSISFVFSRSRFIVSICAE